MNISPERKKLVDIFLDYNSKINLSSIRDAEGVYIKHVLDSLEGLKVLGFDKDEIIRNKKVADIGTGGGFPLLPLAMSLPELQFTGIDSVRKKLQTIEDMCHDLNIENADFWWNRIELINEKFDIVTARAVAHVDKLIPWSINLLKRGSKLLLWKQDLAEEYSALLALLRPNHLKLTHTHRYQLFQGDIERVIYVLERE